QALDEGFCVLDLEIDEAGRATDARILETNPAFEQLTGIVDGVGRSLKEVAPHAQRWLDRYAEVARTGESVRFEEQARELAGGRWFDVFAFRVGPPANHIALLFSEITERKAASA